VLVVLIGVVEHPDMPKSIMGITGLNPWNVLLLFVMLGFLSSRSNESNPVKFPPGIKFLLFIYIFYCFLAYIRMATDTNEFFYWYTDVLFAEPPTNKELFAEHIINTLKWLVPGFLMFYGCNSKERFNYATISLVSIFVLLSLQVIKAMPLGSLLDGDRLQLLALKLLSSNVGFHRVNLAMLLSGAFWAIYSFSFYTDSKKTKYLIYFLCVLTLWALALTGGRTGYATWIAVGFVLAALKWRRLIIYTPVFLMLVVLLVPAAQDRLMQGFSEDNVDQRSEELEKDMLVNENSSVDLYTVTSGRTIAWQFVLDEIGKNPLFGYGKESMIRTGLSKLLMTRYHENFPHPHNMYLQWTLDNGLLGLIPVLIFYFTILKYSLRLFKDRENQENELIGAITLSLVIALFVAGFGSQTFYPREGAVAMWCAIALTIRRYHYHFLKKPE
jgi:O-antigen ligase